MDDAALLKLLIRRLKLRAAVLLFHYTRGAMHGGAALFGLVFVFWFAEKMGHAIEDDTRLSLTCAAFGFCLGMSHRDAQRQLRELSGPSTTQSS